MKETREANAWHALPVAEVCANIESDSDTGLSDEEAARRRALHGANVFQEASRQIPLGRIGRQFKSPLVLILVAAALVTLVLEKLLDTLVIAIALSINVIIGALQERRADRAFETLRSSQERFATVVRSGRRHVVPAAELVPGDLVILSAGQQVPADVRMTDAKELSVNEAPLTGEWVSVEKNAEPVKVGTPLSGRTNMAWMGTLVVSGVGIGVVVATGSGTEMGKIAELLSEDRGTETPIQRNVRKLAVFLTFIIGVVVVGIFGLGIFRGEALADMLFLSIAIAVSAIPEGFPAAVTIVLAVGMERILSRGGLVRNLLAAETLGSTTVILTDKTGTLTEGRMALVEVVTAGVAVGADAGTGDADETLRAAALASDAFVEEGPSEGELLVRGRPVERAIMEAFVERGSAQRVGDGVGTRRAFLPFDSRRRFAAALNMLPGETERRLFVSGAPEFLLTSAMYALRSGKQEHITKTLRDALSALQEDRSRRGKRLIGVAMRTVPWESFPADEAPEAMLEGTTFLGFLVFDDPVRNDVPASIAKARAAGARVIMVTGDNSATALAIAEDVGIAMKDDAVVSGIDIEAMDADALQEALRETRVFSRILPAQKRRLVQTLQRNDEVVAMTGDGINDAPALRRADIGIAVGSGTDVAKEASDLVLINDSFSIIVAAIEEGRRIIDNLKRITIHLLSTSFGEVFVIAGALIAGTALPILPVQILWMNIIQEGLLAFAFAFEPADTDVMRRSPRESRVRTVLTKEVRSLIILAGGAIGALALVLYIALLPLSLPIEELRTMIFIALSLDAFFFAISLKHLRGPFWRGDFRTNKFFLLSLGVSALILVGTLTVPPLRALLSLTPLLWWEFLALSVFALVSIAIIEGTKLLVFGHAKAE